MVVALVCSLTSLWGVWGGIVHRLILTVRIRMSVYYADEWEGFI